MTETRQNRVRARELSRKGWSNYAIALSLDVTERTVRNYLVGPDHEPLTLDERRDRVRALYAAGKKPMEIAAELDLPRATVGNDLQAVLAGVQVRQPRFVKRILPREPYQPYLCLWGCGRAVEGPMRRCRTCHEAIEKAAQGMPECGEKNS